MSRAREQVVATLGWDARKVLFTSGGTEASNLAIRDVTEELESKRHVVTTVIEHAATSRSCTWLTRHERNVPRVGVSRDVRDGRARRSPEAAASTGSAYHEGRDTASAVIVTMRVTPDDALGTVRLTPAAVRPTKTLPAPPARLRSWRRAGHR